MSLLFDKHISAQALLLIKHHIEENSGNEIMLVGLTDDSGLVADVRIVARGDETMVPAVISAAAPGSMLIHNHPSGVVKPSQPDLQIAAIAAERGVGSMIVDNQLTKLFVMVEYLPPEDDSMEPVNLARVGAVLGLDGLLQSVLNDYEVRSPQLDMASVVTKALNKKQLLAVEAGTGTGKSFAYLVPAILWLAQNPGRKVIVSTSTIALEEQLIQKDIPLLLEKAQLADITVALLKGRGNYLCQRKFNDFSRDHMQSSLTDAFSLADTVEELNEWISFTQDGSRSSLTTELSGDVWQSIASSEFECSGSRCHFFEKCFYYRSRRKANISSLILVNHHLLMADVSVKMNSDNQLKVLPAYNALIIDEAHNLFNSAVSFMGESFSSFSLLRQLKRLYNPEKGRGLLKTLQSMIFIDEEIIAIEKLIKETAALPPLIKHSLLVDIIEELQSGDKNASMFELDDSTKRLAIAPFVAEITSRLEKFAILTPIVKRMFAELESGSLLDAERYSVESLLTDLSGSILQLEKMRLFLDSFFSTDTSPEFVFWGELYGKGGVRFTVTPLDLQKVLAEQLYNPTDTIIACSATLSTGRTAKGFDFFLHESGIDKAARQSELVHLPAYFDYKTQLKALVLSDPPLPNDPAYNDWVTAALPSLISASKGGALVLFTSIAQRNAAAQQIKGTIPFPIFVQGEQHASTLLQRFRDDKISSLFATDLFWEGVDIKGESLRNLLIMRLPFKFPRHPFIKRYIQVLEQQTGKGGFGIYTLPMAILKFKQGVGRLIRTKQDRGTIVMFDKRLFTVGYGKQFQNALPEDLTFEKVQLSQAAHHIKNFLK
ncbi:DEAD/DEAH box helicase family protein [bacterium]|nr:DEAD/DEAH box helicase family protein [bacterium]